MIHSKVKNDYKKARISRDILLKKPLSTLLDAFTNKAKDVKVDILDDAKAIQIILYWKKQMEQLLTRYVNYPDKLKEIKCELDVYCSYLPKQLSDSEIKDIILTNNLTTIASTMRHFNIHYLGKFDSKNVLNILSKTVS